MLSLNRIDKTRQDKTRQDKNDVKNDKTANIVKKWNEKYKNYRNKNTN